MQIVDGIEACPQNFVHLLQMMQISARVTAARCASAGGIERTGVVLVLGVADLDVLVRNGLFVVSEPVVDQMAYGCGWSRWRTKRYR